MFRQCNVIIAHSNKLSRAVSHLLCVALIEAQIERDVWIHLPCGLQPCLMRELHKLMSCSGQPSSVLKMVQSSWDLFFFSSYSNRTQKQLRPLPTGPTCKILFILIWFIIFCLPLAVFFILALLQVPKTHLDSQTNSKSWLFTAFSHRQIHALKVSWQRRG